MTSLPLARAFLNQSPVAGAGDDLDAQSVTINAAAAAIVSGFILAHLQGALEPSHREILKEVNEHLVAELEKTLC